MLAFSTVPSNYSQLLEATSPSFTCSAVIDYTIFGADEVTVTYEWTSSIVTDDVIYNITTNDTQSSTLNVIYLTRKENNAVFTCAVHVVPKTSAYVLNNSASIQFTIRVQGMALFCISLIVVF